MTLLPSPSLFPTLSPLVMKSLDRYTSLLLEWNSRIRLTGYHSKDQIREHLLLEPILSFFFLRSRVPDTFPRIDFGSGNGSPGLILAILDPDHSYILIERTEKKRVFLDYAVRHLSLSNVTILPALDRPLISPLVFMKAITIDDFLSDKHIKSHTTPPCFFVRFGKDSSDACLPLRSYVINGGVSEWGKHITFSLFLLEFSG